MKKKIVLFFLILFLLTTNVYAIDTGDWERSGASQLVFAKPEKEFLIKTTFYVLRDYFPGYEEGGKYSEKNDEALKKWTRTKEYEQFFHKDSNSITVPISNNWHDLTEFKAFYSKAEISGYICGISYKFTKGSFTLLDVLGRYGCELAEIKTMEDLSREIVYTLKYDTLFGKDKNHLSMLIPIRQKEITLMIFRSKDKIFIDNLIILTGPK